ncbi:aspartyl/glutamyl-tRNA(Asn/Gln) amidotransferase subunit B [Thermaerobacter marianensis DSM 12885]|uniref:Aspartyl/glutamyl-tRNA(Asn/Gln) amidotransferase subunit B n=1 Tax=Thermaerobacter marianensis (strain ATCC 700841 / DSM 12885 / JCM 10246 / 7p75a) TaxID=644966 RepID=E6SMG6_THEM7|nr:Asp-tRNA(Asn)/Glu-tRNA(Gln) amidotransferase subunit GatB [Thermaerobacter marianensis]ADU50426.1 aspartyl/glutamyl-tRNA(Asn/Gln) amidotransferase subunit B [Thermaerobacter marianensis DSM 12885]
MTATAGAGARGGPVPAAGMAPVSGVAAGAAPKGAAAGGSGAVTAPAPAGAEAPAAWQEKNGLRYRVIVGLEVHVELRTRTKIFCSCPNQFGAEPNTHVCPVCMGLPGTLPVLNRQALEYAALAALALNCRIARETKFDRKNYTYPDLPKGYQISQYDQPLATGGWVEIDAPAGPKRVRIRRLHLEEDAGKSVHDQDETGTLLDFNRAGVPLIEIVTEPDLASPEEARLFLQELRAAILYTGVSDVRMEEGSLRCDANVNVVVRGAGPDGGDLRTPITEIKNLNSFRSVVRALEYEVERHLEAVRRGERLERETRHWDEQRGRTRPSRGKEEAHDYRYFPEPDLPRLVLDEAWVEGLRARLPELPRQRRARYVEELGLPAYDAGVLTADPALARFFEDVVAAGVPAKAASNWIMSEVLAHLNATGREVQDLPFGPGQLAALLQLVEKGTISGKIAKQVFAEMLETGGDPETIVRERGLVQVTDEGQLVEWVERAIAENPEAVANYKGGKTTALGFLVGQVMRYSKGKANPQRVNELLKERLDG